jgi:hypothetical protein
VCLGRRASPRFTAPCTTHNREVGGWNPPGAIAVPERNAILALVGIYGVELVEEWNDPEYVNVKWRDPDGYIIEASWEPEQ